MLDEMPVQENSKPLQGPKKMIAMILFSGMGCLFFYLAYKALTIVRF